MMLITPLIGVVGSPQPDYVRAARALGIPTALCVWSWDHLSSKALIRDVPDRIFVWNHVQRGEARRFHGVRGHRVVAPARQCFDQWFGRQPRGRAISSARRSGLPADRPVILYVGSAYVPGKSVRGRVRPALDRAAAGQRDPRVRGAALLIGRTRSGWANGTTWISRICTRMSRSMAANPVTDSGARRLYDSLFHSAVVVGLNTSAFLEAGIVGRPVLAILPPEYQDNQEGTLHFRYLTDVQGGLPVSAGPSTNMKRSSVMRCRKRRPRGTIDHRGVPASTRHRRGGNSRVCRRRRGARRCAGACRPAVAVAARACRARGDCRRGPFATLSHVVDDEEDRRTHEWRRMKGAIR
jgi:hypothetical protein